MGDGVRSVGDGRTRTRALVSCHQFLCDYGQMLYAQPFVLVWTQTAPTLEWRHPKVGLGLSPESAWEGQASVLYHFLPSFFGLLLLMFQTS